MDYLKTDGSTLAGTTLSRLGLGTMRMPADWQAGIRAIHAALDSGINFLNTGDFYSAGSSESIVGEALKGRKREEAFVSVKFGGLQTVEGGMYGFDSRPEAIENYLVYSLRRLQMDHVDLYQPCRINPHIPVEESIGAISRLVEKGYVRHIGLSEVDADTLVRAHSTHPISLVEVSYSLMNRKIEDTLIPAARAAGIGVVAFGVLLSGIIGGSAPHQKLEALGQFLPPSSYANLRDSLALSDALQQLADEKGITLAQLAMAWVLAQGQDILALVGSRTAEQVADTRKAIQVQLSHQDRERIEKLMPKQKAGGDYMPTPDIRPSGVFKM